MVLGGRIELHSREIVLRYPCVVIGRLGMISWLSTRTWCTGYGLMLDNGLARLMGWGMK